MSSNEGQTVEGNTFDDAGLDEDDENVAVEKLDSWFVFAHVHEKVLNISCGDASQRVKWLAHVAICKTHYF